MENVSPDSIVEKQLFYYNSRDIEGFLSTYSENIRMYNLGEDSPFLSGLEDLRERYTQRFSNPALHADIANRMIIGNKVIDYEHVKGVKQDQISKVVAIYEVVNCLIERVWFVRTD